MRVVPINEAEAIIEPFWDPYISSTTRPGITPTAIGPYEVWTAPGAATATAQGWCALTIAIDAAQPGETAIRLERACDIDVGDYDIFRMFVSAPQRALLTVSAVIDGQRQVLLDGVPGTDDFAELDGAMSGTQMTGLRLEAALSENRPAAITIHWLGLSNRAAQARMEARANTYTSAWPGLLDTTPGEAAPEIGIYFGADELEALRAKTRQGHGKLIFDRMRKSARAHMDCEPERVIGRHVPLLDRRWCRTRDMCKPPLHVYMPLLAFVGLIDNDPAMLRMAARMALSVAHCDTWCESLMGVFPGGVWHHRSFTEENFCRACGLVLDWAGSQLTENGKEVIRDAIIMKGLPRLESDFKRWEYIRSMNQGVVFSSGRITALLSVLPKYPRYASQLDEAERDFLAMIDANVGTDGGTLEGMGYWGYTFGTAMPTVYALARRRGKTLREYAPASLRKTGKYPLAMMSLEGDGIYYLPINDAHGGRSISPALVAAYAQMMPHRRWKDLYATMMAAGESDADIFHLIIAPPDTGVLRPLDAPRFDVQPVTGQVSAVRKDTALGAVHFHLCSGPVQSGHYHEDKGSFILEAGGEGLAIDRGVTDYSHPDTALMGAARWHNLLYPEASDGTLLEQPGHAAGGELTCARQTSGVLLLTSDNAAAWEPGVFSTNIRRILSPTPDLYLIDDEIVMPRALAMSFRLNSRFDMEARDGAYWVHGAKASLRIVPLNWTPLQAHLGVDGIDSHEHPVNLMRLYAPVAPQHRLLTAIEVVPRSGKERLWRFEIGDTIIASRGNTELRVALAHDPAITAEWRKVGKTVLTAVGMGGEWVVE